MWLFNLVLHFIELVGVSVQEGQYSLLFDLLLHFVLFSHVKQLVSLLFEGLQLFQGLLLVDVQHADTSLLEDLFTDALLAHDPSVLFQLVSQHLSAQDLLRIENFLGKLRADLRSSCLKLIHLTLRV